MSSAGEAVDRLRKRIENGGKQSSINKTDREALLTFSDRVQLLAQEYTDKRHLKLLRHCVIVAETLDSGTLAEALTDRDAAERIVSWINVEYDNEETNRDYRVALRVFGKRVAEADESIDTTPDGLPESLAWVPTGTSSDYDPTPDPREMLRYEEDVKAMIDATYNARDAAMIALQFDAGLRGGEFKDLAVGDVRDHDHGLEVTVEGKQGRRTVLLIPSVPHVSAWLDAHPAGDNHDAPLWSKITKPESISDRMVSKILNEAADRADVSKPVTLTNFRKSSAAFLASRNLNQAHIEDHHGWVRGSSAAARYISVFGEDSDRELARLHGIDVSEDEPEDISPIECPTCGRENERDASFCMQCGQVLSPEAASELDESTDELNESLASLEPEKAERLLEVADMLDDPAVREALVDSE
ncbi:tyrosine-type recombinase/integrase [Halonotius roseus]|uniref:Site-specific integrase n=1 Tax=Halonotius roseus TaxID=2511997 RepID=A0A544QQV7_9EURY|nr:tyrosine-type recombinase/integrase [Halonotius roseus]TQQ81823.1 site-specific integrase [Halonotius roseus]